MSENESAITEGATENSSENAAAEPAAEDISYHAVEKDGVVTAIWEMQGRKHVRQSSAITPGAGYLRLYTTEHPAICAAEASEAHPLIPGLPGARLSSATALVSIQ